MVPDSERSEHDEDIDLEEEDVPEFTLDVSHLTPTSIEVIANQVCPQSLRFVKYL